MGRVTRGMTIEKALDALSGEVDEIYRAINHVMYSFEWNDSKKKQFIIDLYDKHNVVDEGALYLYKEVAGSNPDLFILILLLEETGARRFDLAKNLGSDSGRKKIKQVVSKDPFVQMTLSLILKPRG